MPRIHVTLVECWNCKTVYDSSEENFCPVCGKTPEEEFKLLEDESEENE
ncbi:MAG: hypothetical protein WC346_05760 [Methanogenium sp.]|jgi:rRNA maturation endonuclease Nob1